MNATNIALAVIAVLLVSMAILFNGRYEAERLNDRVVLRIDRLTGRVALCEPRADERGTVGIACIDRQMAFR